MRGIFGLLGILVTLAIVGVLVKKQTGAIAVVPATPGTADAIVPATTPGASPQQQSQQIGQQVKQAVDASLQTPRGEPAP